MIATVLDISDATREQLINSAYLLAATLFILGLRGLAHPRTAVRGNLLGSLAMLIAIVATLLKGGLGFSFIIAGLGIGAVVGLALAVTIQMTAMPQLVAAFNGFGGIASVLVAGGMMYVSDDSMDTQRAIATAASGLIGGVTFSGSLVAFAKLQGLISGNAILLPLRHLLNILLSAAAIGLCVWLTLAPEAPVALDAKIAYWILVAVALVLGILLTIPIGGADMPVVIALLNSYSGLAAAATGFVIANNVLIVAGSLVGASGLILTSIMCKAMNRSLTGVLFGVLGPTEETASADEIYAGRVKTTSADEVAMLLDGARRVVFAPGYGLAVAQAQHAVRDLADLLEADGIEVEHAIHPVAGRMPWWAQLDLNQRPPGSRSVYHVAPPHEDAAHQRRRLRGRAGPLVCEAPQITRKQTHPRANTTRRVISPAVTTPRRISLGARPSLADSSNSFRSSWARLASASATRRVGAVENWGNSPSAPCKNSFPISTEMPASSSTPFIK